MQELATKYAEALVAYYIEIGLEAQAKAENSIDLDSHTFRVRNASNRLVNLQNAMTMVAKQEAEEFLG
jgi:hypothetical protein